MSGALLAYAVYVSVRSHCFVSRRRYAGEGGMSGLYIEDPSLASLSASSFPGSLLLSVVLKTSYHMISLRNMLEIITF